MSVMLLRADVKPESVAEAEAATKAMFASLEEAAPAGVRYASSRLSGSNTFVVLVQIEDGVENPLPAVPEWVAFQAQLKDWLAGPPTTEELAVVGSYNLFS
jgi:hypothetical protein